MSQIMKPRLEVRIVMALDACDSSQTREACTGNLGGNGMATRRLEQWSIVLILSSRLVKILLDQLLDMWSQRHEPGLIELCVSDRH
jgi:hypothetical protein